MEKILINIDSQFRNITKFKNPGKYTYILNEPIKNVVSIRLASIELPTTFYTFMSSLNNTSFGIITGEDNQHWVNIKDGNYNSSQMISYIQTELNNINSLYSTNLKISWDDIDYKVTISNTTPFTLIFDNNSEYRTLGDRLGYRGQNSDYLKENQQTSFDESSNAYVYSWTGETFLDITKGEYLFLKVNDYGNIYNDLRDKDILAKIILYDQQFVIDNGANFLTKEYKFKQPTNISKFDIELINMLGNTIDMNLINFSMTFELIQIYDQKLYDKIKFDVFK